MSDRPAFRNIHGRKWGRGLRPWLLIPKYIFVSGFLGGLATLLVLEYLGPAPQTSEAWQDHAATIRRAYTLAIVPALWGAMAAGVALFLQHPVAFWRMRWFRVKLAVAAVCIPGLHFYMRHWLLELRAALEVQDWPAATACRDRMFYGTAAAIGFALAMILLGRLKPRLGQRYGPAKSDVRTEEALPGHHALQEHAR